MLRDFRLSQSSDRERYEHIRDASRDVIAFVARRTRGDLDHDVMLRRALANAVQEIGEAAAKLSDEARALAPSIPWTKLVETRNVIVHVYRGINRDILWLVATTRMTELLEAAEAAINQLIESDDRAV